MASSDIRQFYFYLKYIWSPDDFSDLQEWIFDDIEGIAEGAFGAAVLSGLRPRGGGGMTLLVDAGIAVNASGRIVVVDSQLNTSVTSPVGNPARTLVVLRPKTTDMTDIPEPTNLSNMVPLHKKFDYDLVVLNGTPAGSPVYPSTQAGDIVVAGLKLTAGHTTISESDLDWGVIDRPRKRKSRISVKTASFSATGTDDIYEVDFSAASGVAQLPAAADNEGLKITFVKIDSTSNDCAVSGNGAETISGQNYVMLDTQWQALTVYSNGISWRQI